MPIKVQKDLPVAGILEAENIFVMDEDRAIHQDIRPLQILILNLMPLKEPTELQLLRLLSNSPIQVDVTFMMVTSHSSKNTSLSHINKFYETFADIKKRYFDGMIITGTPLEFMTFEEVDFWHEICMIMRWSEKHVTSTMFQCWACQAALYFFYGINKRIMPEKVFGLYQHKVNDRRVPLVRGFDDVFWTPHSRHTEILKEDIEKIPGMVILAESEEAGVFLCMLEDGSQIFVLGHPEYDRLSLNNEYRRDIGKGLPIQVPLNYYPNDDPAEKPLLMWRAHASILYSNWLNYYVYQVTPYDITKVHHDGYNTTI